MNSAKRLKIAHVLPFYSPVIGGMEALVKNTTEMLAQKGHEVHVLTTDRGHDGKKLNRPSVEKISGVQVHRFRCYFMLGFISFFPGFAAQLWKGKYDVVHVHAYRHPHTDIASWVSRLKKIPVILHGHGPFYNEAIPGGKAAAYRLYDVCAKFLILKSVNHIFAFTELEKSEYVKRGADPKKITVIPNGIPDRCFESADPGTFLSEYGLKGKRIVLCAGRLHANKSHDVLLKAFAAAAQSAPDCSLVLIGPDAGQAEKLQALAQSLGLGERFRWLGVIPGEMLTAAYRSAACFVMPSLYEPFGLVLLEAMAAGAPVLASDAGGPCEIVKSGENGFLFEPGNAEDLAGKLRALLENPDLAKRTGEKGRLRAEEFRFKPLLNRMEFIYFELAADGNK